MTPKSIQDILPLVEMPSRYLGTEVNRIIKDPQSVDLNVALAFPDLYEIGSSHFGIQILYHLLNARSDIAAERVFAPAPDMEAQLRKNDLALFSLESRRPIQTFDIVGFSLLYELTYTNVLNMLQLGRIPLLATERELSDPIVIAGGPCTCNPEPMAEIFDAMVIGDGEETLLKMCDVFMAWRKDSNRTKTQLLQEWAKIQGIYIPNFFEGNSNKIERQSVQRAVVSDLNKAHFPENPLIPFGKPVHDRLRLEVSRGCSRGCRFCQAGMIYRPVRERQPERLVEMADTALKSTGYEDLSLLSLSTGDYGCINDLMKRLMHTCETEHVAISLPSLRAGTLHSGLMEQIKKVRKTGFTIAPEAGSQRLRDVINKNITEQDIIQTVQSAFEMGWQVIKLYFMIGLPTERQEDLDAIVELVKKLRQLKAMKARKNKINVSVATFIPKAHTPFQWAPQISRERAWEIIMHLKDRLNIGGIQFKWQNPDISLIEGVMARGDRRIGHLILAAFRNGCKFDGWNDHFNFEKWQQASAQINMDLNAFTDRPIDPEAFLPWEHVDIGITKAFFLEEWEKALLGNLSPDCRFGECQTCGLCDFEKIRPILFNQENADFSGGEDNPLTEQDIPVYQKFFVTYQKKDNARFLGHLEMAKVFHRALKRAGIKTEFSKGFHPMPKVSFDNPLPLGMESNCEHFVIAVSTDISALQFQERINHQLPDGLRLVDVQLKKCSKKVNTIGVSEYRIIINDGFFDQNRLNSFIDRDACILQRKSQKGQIKHIDLKAVVKGVRIEAPDRLIISLVEEPGKIVRPLEILEQIFGFQNERARSARVLKLSVQDQ